MPAFIYLQARDHSIPFANKYFKKIFGDTEGRPCYEAIQCRDKPCPECLTFKVFDTRQPQEWEFTAANGNVYQIYDYPFTDVNGMPLVIEMGIDITERKQVDKALRESEASLIKAQRIAHVGNYVLDLAHDEAVCSDEFYRILGLGPQEYFSYESFLTFLHPDDLEIFDSEVRKARDQGKKYNNDFRIVRPDGSVRRIHCEGEMALDGNGKSIQMFGIIQDITERKSIEESLRKLSRAVEESPASVVITDVQGDIEYVNPKFTALTGYTLEEAIGKNPRILKSGKTPPEEYERLWVTILGGNEWRCEFLNKKKNGELYWESAIISPIKDDRGRITHYMAIKEDITERKQAEEALLESEEKFRVLANTCSAVIYLHQGENTVYVNEAGERITGYSKDELLKMKFWEIMHPDSRELVKERGLARQRGETVPSPYEVKLATKGGETRWAELAAGRIMYMGKPAVVATFFDITDRKRAEEALSDANARAELYLDLMGHDINNMNQVALGYLEMADDVIRSGEKLSEENRELIEKPMVSLNGSSKLIEKVMKLRKLKERELRFGQVDLCDILKRVKDRYSHVTGRDVTINYVPLKECLIVANELIDEIFINLIENSIKHSKQDKPLVINILKTRVWEEDKEYYRISIEDNGPGIPDEVKEKLFTRFHRGQTMAKGKGLGLYLVRTLVEDFGGRTWVEDRVPGDHTKGAKFVVMLPTV